MGVKKIKLVVNPELEAIQFDGSDENWKELVEWSDGDECDFVDSEMTSSGECECSVVDAKDTFLAISYLKCWEGAWVVKYGEDDFRVVSDEEVKRNYVEV